MSVREKRSSPESDDACARKGVGANCAAAVRGCSVSAVKVIRTTPAIGRSAFDLNTVSPFLIRSLRLREEPAYLGFLQHPPHLHALSADADTRDPRQPLGGGEKLPDRLLVRARGH